MQTRNFLLTTFLLLSLLNITANFANWPTLILLTKPLLMTTLAAWFYFATDKLSGRISRFIFIGLLFSWAGDCFLLFVNKNPNFFLFGLGSFLVAHLFYIASFLKFPGWEKGWVRREIWPIVPVAIYLGAMLFFLWPDLPEAFKIPVAVYSLVISLMLLAAMNMRGRMDEKAARFLILGALLFVLSDSLIAVGKFKTTGISEAIFSVGIMSTYLVGQYLIASRSQEIHLPKTKNTGR